MSAKPQAACTGTDVFTPEQRSAVMRAVPGKNSSAELRVRRLLTRMGLRYRLHRRDLPGSPDIVFGPRRLALFVHGCFWHGHDCPRGARAPKANAAYWSAKIGRNRTRDASAQAALTAMDWTAVVIWECELKDPAGLEQRLREILPQGPRAARGNDANDKLGRGTAPRAAG